MYKCPNCGSEFDGNFCPECGTRRQEDKTCPKCGSICPSSANFCTNCGYLFNQNNAAPADKTSNAAPRPQVHVYVKQQKSASPLISKIYEYLKYAPVFIFAAFSVLLFVFYCAPVAEMALVGSMGNVYTLTGVSEISEIQSSMIALIILAVLYLSAAAAGVYCFVKFKSKYIVIGRFAVGVMQLCGIISIVLYIITLIIGSVACGILSSIDGGLGLISAGAAPVLIIVFSALFMVLAAGALITRVVLNKKYYNVIPEEERAAKEACRKQIDALPELPVKNAAFNALKYIPSALFALFSVLSIVFLAASGAVLPAQELLGVKTPAESYGSVYTLAGGDTLFTEIRPYMIMLIAAMVLSLCYSLAVVFVPKRKIKDINLFGYITVPLYAVWLALGCVTCVQISAYDEGFGLISAGAAPILIIVFSIIFALLAVGAYIAKYVLARKDPALSSFERDLFEKKQQRKAEIKQRKQQLAEEYKAANPAPEAVVKPSKRNLAYYKAKRAQNFKTSIIFWDLAIVAILGLCFYIFVGYIIFTAGYFKETDTSFIYNLLHPNYLLNNISYLPISLSGFWKFVSTCMYFGLPALAISIIAIILLSRRELKSINSACSFKGLKLIWFFLLILTVALFVIPANGFTFSNFAERIKSITYFSDFTSSLCLVLFILTVIYAIPYFISRHFIKNARFAIYGDTDIKGLNPKISFEQLYTERDNYQNMKKEYNTYRKAYAAYKAALTDYVNENLTQEINGESNENDAAYSEKVEQSKETAQTDIDN